MNPSYSRVKYSQIGIGTFAMTTRQDLETTACPLCASDLKQIAYEFSPFVIVECQQCGLHYLSPRLTEAAMLQYYQNDDYFRQSNTSGYTDYSEQEQALRLTFARCLKQLQQLNLVGERLLEVGCGYGYFLDEAQPYFRYRAGTDFSPQAVEIARTHADKIYLGGLESIDPDERFDCIVAINVLEHTYNPLQFLQQMKAMLNPGGVVLTAVPNMGSFIRFFMQKRWPSFKVPEHTLYFKQDTLLRAFTEVNFDNVQAFPFPHAFPLALIAKKFGWQLPAALSQWSLWVPTTMVAVYGTKE
jgi:2-polyprenyl-3-methyl-5-hydroxy-6-metoxy-1,4-benzoquinol methylase